MCLHSTRAIISYSDVSQKFKDVLQFLCQYSVLLSTGYDNYSSYLLSICFFIILSATRKVTITDKVNIKYVFDVYVTAG